MTTGVFANVYVQSASWSSLTTLLVAFGTAFNNGKNVVDPINAIIEDPKGDKGGGQTHDNNTDFANVLEGVTKGHWIDVIGFTAIFVTRLMVDWYIAKRGRELAFSTPLAKKLFTNLNINFLGKRKIAYIISIILVGVGAFSLFTKGLQEGVDFIGGRSYQIRFEKEVNASEIASGLNEVCGSGTQV